MNIKRNISKHLQKILAMASMKGGVGKSKANVGLAAHIAVTMPGSRVLLVDACQDQGYLSEMLAYEKDENQMGLGSIILAMQEGESHDAIAKRTKAALTRVCVSTTQNKYIDFLPAAAETLGDLTLLGWKETSRGELLDRFIKEYAMGYTHIIFDTVPLVRIPTTASVFAIADSIGLIVDCTEPNTLAGINRFCKSARLYGAELRGVVTNLYDQKITNSRAAKKVIETLCSNAGLRIITTIPRSATMVNSTNVYQTKDGDPATGLFVGGEFDKSQTHLFDRLQVHFEQIARGMEA